MAETDMMEVDLGLTAEEFAGLKLSYGEQRTRVPYGDVRLRIVGGEIQAKEGKNPHNMTKFHFEVVHTYNEAHKEAIGAKLQGIYSGSQQSPAFLKQRMKALCEAVKVTPPLKISKFIGKEFDASVVWELSQSNDIDVMTGRPKMFVNDRVKGERAVGSKRPDVINPELESARAVKYLEGAEAGLDFGAAAGGTADEAPWEGGAQAAAGGSETNNEGLVAMYRAIYKIGGSESESAKQSLVEAGIDPEGPVDVNLIDDAELRAAYDAKFTTAAPKKGLQPLNGPAKPRTGTRAPQART